MIISSHIQLNHVPERPDSSSGESLAVGFQPPPGYSIELGSIYMLFEQKQNDKRLNVDKLIQACGRAFYSSGAEVSFEARYRMCLKAANEVLKKSKSLCNFGIVAINQETILFASVGDVDMRLIRNKTAPKLASQSKSNYFNDIGEGQLQAKDRIILLSRSCQTKEIREELTKLVNSSDHVTEERLQDEVKLPAGEAYSILIVFIKNELPDKTSDEEKNISTVAKQVASKLPLKKSNTKPENKVRNIKTESTKQKTSKYLGEFLASAKRGWTQLWSKHINTNPKKALTISLAAVLVIIFTIAVFTISSSSLSSPSRKIELASKEVSEAEQLVNENNQKSASDKLSEASKTINSIPEQEVKAIKNQKDNNKNKQLYLNTLTKIQQLQDRIDNVVRINTQSYIPIPQNNLASLVWANDRLYGLDSSGGKIIEINPLLGDPIIKGANADLNNARVARGSSDGNVLIIGSSALWEYSSGSGLQQLKASNLPVSVDIASYSGNVYLLSPNENQVVRYAKSSNTLSARTNMLKNLSNNQLKAANSLAVEGNIFLSNNRQIQLFVQGNENNYSVNNLPSSFGEIAQMQYNDAKKYFVVLNKDKNKLAILSANSSSADFIKSYALEGNQAISSYCVSADGTLIFINTGNKIINYKIEK